MQPRMLRTVVIPLSLGLALIACGDAQNRSPQPAPSESGGAAVEPATASLDPEPAVETAETGEPPEPAVRPMAPDGTPMLPCGDGPEEMACIPGGAFIRGSDEGDENTRPRAEVWLQTYWMDKNEVTNAEYDACEAAGKCPKSGPQYVDFDRPKQPINGVSWFDANAYCEAQGLSLIHI